MDLALSTPRLPGTKDQQSIVAEKLWKNLKDSLIYRTRMLNGRLYVEDMSSSVAGKLITCEFTPSVLGGLTWVGKCWHYVGGTREVTASITTVSNVRIEGSEFILIPVQ